MFFIDTVNPVLGALSNGSSQQQPPARLAPGREPGSCRWSGLQDWIRILQKYVDNLQKNNVLAQVSLVRLTQLKQPQNKMELHLLYAVWT